MAGALRLAQLFLALACNAALKVHESNTAPCQCQGTDPSWVAPQRAQKAKCIFIDLGAANGNSFQQFLQGSYTRLADCPNGGKWEAVLVEANPRFNQDLQQVAANHPGQITAMTSSAAYMCEAETSFYLDTVNTQKNYWGSSLSPSHQDVVKSGKVKVTVPTKNLLRILHEHTTAEDYVIVKMDIEGAEFDILPCLAKSSSHAKLIDKLFMEVHDPAWGLMGTTEQEFQQAQTTLRSQGVQIPSYNSPTLLQKHSMSQGQNPVQIAVLTYGQRTSPFNYAETFPDIQVHVTVGLTAMEFSDTEQMMATEQLVPMTEQMNDQWRSNPTTEENLALHKPLGSLACALGHYKIWQTAVSSLKGREWMVILEDDARPLTTSSQLRTSMASVPADVDMVFLGNRHCKVQYGSAAYAITAKGAQALLDIPFANNVDYLLDVPGRTGIIKNFCLPAPLFQHAPPEAKGTSMTRLSAFGNQPSA